MKDHWLILRTRGRDTLKLAEQLVKEGFHAWAPKRTFAKQAKGEALTLTAPMLPSFAFARADHVHALLALAEDPRKPCADFSVFTFLDRIPLVREGELHRMRQIEENDLKRMEAGKAKRRKPQFETGQSIRLTTGAWSGKVGEVEKDDGRTISLSIDGRRVKISAFLLEQENVQLAA